MLYEIPVLRPGTYRLPPSPAHPKGKTVRYTQADARHVCDQGNKQIQVGLVHPMCWMHDPKAEPEYLSNRHDGDWPAKGYIGETKRFKVRPDGTTVALVDITDPKDAKQFDKFRRVSPCLLYDWVDEQNKLWPGLSIIHIGATPTPVQRNIGKAVPAYLSHSKTNPAIRLRVSEMHWLSYQATPRSESMADDNEMEMMDEEVMVDDEMGDGDADNLDGDEMVADAVKYLADHGILHLGDPKNWGEFMVALKAAIATDKGGDGDADDTDDVDTETEQVSRSPMMLSMAARVAILEEKDLKRRVEALDVRGIDAATRARLANDIAKVNLSHEPVSRFNKDGTLKSFDALVELAAYEKLPVRKIATKANLSNTAQVANVIADDKKDGDDLVADLRKQRGVADNDPRLTSK